MEGISERTPPMPKKHTIVGWTNKEADLDEIIYIGVPYAGLDQYLFDFPVYRKKQDFETANRLDDCRKVRITIEWVEETK
jgi:hypothetical protein